MKAVMSLPLLEETASPKPVRLVPRPLSPWRRFGLVTIAVVAGGVLGLARRLEPDGRGFGTHEQLGLPPCSFLVLTGVRCPSCGMTTSFAYVVRGQLWSAARTNVAGGLLALVAIMLVPWSLASAVAGRTLGLRSPERAVVYAVTGLVATSVAGWAVRFLLMWGQR